MMTKQEAIKHLEFLKIAAEIQAKPERVETEALDMAIKALEQEPCEDAISRQAVLDIIDGYYSCFEDAEEFEQKVREIPPVTSKTDILDKIRAEIEQKARPNEKGGRGNGKSIRYGLCIALDIIDKYKESEGK
jgi:hypothetical protein